MGVVTHTIQGETYHAASSMDVQFEGENAIRFIDLTTHNHMCPPNNSADTTMDVATAAPPTTKDCGVLEDENKGSEKFSPPHAAGGTERRRIPPTSHPSDPSLVAGHSWAGADVQRQARAGHQTKAASGRRY